MKTYFVQGPGLDGIETVTVTTPKDARGMVEDAVIELGRDAVFRWITGGCYARNDAVSRVLCGENPRVVARDFTR